MGGGGVTANECQYIFLQPPKKGLQSIPPTEDVASVQGQNTFLSTILDSVRPDVLRKVIDASLNATQDLDEAKKASLIGAIASVAAEKAEKEEKEITRTLMDIVDQRVQRLENRIALLDDVEALLEAERVALELERRDMYTARCRQWFGDGSS
jgi:SWI/SNF related-matrix-associated actin-dependent regulator of chromatin subfamily C